MFSFSAEQLPRDNGTTFVWKCEESFRRMELDFEADFLKLNFLKFQAFNLNFKIIFGEHFWLLWASMWVCVRSVRVV